MKTNLIPFFQLYPNLIGVIHFAALKDVKESCHFPDLYMKNNVTAACNLLRCMEKHHVYNIIFSSSACVYGEPRCVPIKEDFPTSATNPYGESKRIFESCLKEVYDMLPEKWHVVILRYFNPIGAHPSGILGEDPRKPVSNLMPTLAQVTTGKLSKLLIFGNDYPTPDKTAIRDYVHVTDIAKGHVAAVNKFKDHSGFWVYNLGSGNGHSVLEVIENYRKASGMEIPYVFEKRRCGDVPLLVADSSAAQRELKWKAEYGIEEMCRDFCNWQRKNPNGYKTQSTVLEKC